MERASVLQNTQIAPEAVPGTAVPANRLLASLSITTAMDVATEQFRPQGSKYNTAGWVKTETTKLSAEGIADYNEIGYLLASAVNRPVTTTNPDGTHTHVFTSSSRSADQPVSYTIETGDSIRAVQTSYALFNTVGIELSRDGAKVTGEGFARPAAEGITMTASPVQAEATPVIPTEVTTYLSRDTDVESLVPLSRNFKAGFSLGGRFSPVHVLDASNPAFVAHVETVPELTGSVTVEADSQGMSFLPDLRTGNTVYLRQEAVGAVIGTGTARNRLTIDASFIPSGVSAPQDEDGVYAIEWNLSGVHDPTRDCAFQITLVNTTASYA